MYVAVGPDGNQISLFWVLRIQPSMLLLNLMSNRYRRHKIMIKMTKPPTLLEKLEWRATLSPEATTTLLGWPGVTPPQARGEQRGWTLLRVVGRKAGREEWETSHQRLWSWGPGGLPDRNTGKTTSGLPKSRNPTAGKTVLLHLNILTSNWYPSRKHFKYLQRKTHVYLRDVNSQIQGVHGKAVQPKPEADNSPHFLCDHPTLRTGHGPAPPQSHHTQASQGCPSSQTGGLRGMLTASSLAVILTMQVYR